MGSKKKGRETNVAKLEGDRKRKEMETQGAIEMPTARLTGQKHSYVRVGCMRKGTGEFPNILPSAQFLFFSFLFPSDNAEMGEPGEASP